MDKDQTLVGSNSQIQILLKQNLQLATHEGMKKYKEIIITFVDSNEPFMDTQLKIFHEQTKQNIILKFQDTYQSLVNTEFAPILQDALNNLEKSLNLQLPTILKRYEVNVDKIMERIKYCTLYAENHYDDLMMGFVPSESTKLEIKEKHDKAKAAALVKFTEVVGKESLQIQEDWKFELESKFEEKLADMMQECMETSYVVAEEEAQLTEVNTSWFKTNNFDSDFFQPTKNVLPSQSKTLPQDLIHNNQQTTHSSAKFDPNQNIAQTLTSPIATLGSNLNSRINVTLKQPELKGKEIEVPPSTIIPEVQMISKEHPNNTAQHLDIGVYFDKTSVIVGRINPKTSDLEILMKTSPQMAFFEDSVVIGEEAAKYKNQRNHFHISDVLLQEMVTVSVKSFQQRLTKDKALLAYFMKLRTELLATKEYQSVRTAVITIPYATTSIQRGWIKMAAQKAFGNVRVISSLLATAATYAANSQFYLQEERDQKPQTVFVAQSLRTEFSMAAIEVGPAKIVTKSIVTSKTFQECSTFEFINWHHKLFSGERLDYQKQNYIFQVYQNAARQLFDSVVGGRKCAEHALLIQSSNELDRICYSLFEDQVRNHLELTHGPLFGACMLAERINPSVYSLPPDIPICDKSWTIFSIEFGAANGSVPLNGPYVYNGPEMAEFNKSAFQKREVFIPAFELKQDTSRIVLLETHKSNTKPLEVDSHYFMDNANGLERQVGIGLKCDEDGVVKLVVNQIDIVS